MCVLFYRGRRTSLRLLGAIRIFVRALRVSARRDTRVAAPRARPGLTSLRKATLFHTF